MIYVVEKEYSHTPQNLSTVNIFPVECHILAS
jgi:hypothetical protein